ncbi:MAG: TolC family protein [Legionellaceae bacterium]|nr:TolC family protein [Legionellaceae bacterium]
MRKALFVIKILTRSILYFSLSCLISINGYADDDRTLSLEELLRTVNSNYPQIIAARLQVVKAKGDYISALGKFDPNIRVKTRHLPVGGYISKYANNEIDVPTLINGLKFFGGYRIGVGEFPIYYQNYLTNSKGEYRAGLSLPLMRDRLIDTDRTNLFTRTETIAINKHEVTSTKLSVYQDAIKAYWDWTRAGLQLKVLIKMLKLAEFRQRALERQAKLGDLPQIALVENKQIIMQRKQWVNKGRMALEQAAVGLSLYYRTQDGSPMIPSKRKLLRKIPSYKPNSMKSSYQIEQQLKRHPDLCKLERYLRIVKLKQNLAKNELLPNLDATAFASKQYGTNGYPLLLPQAAQIGVRFKFPVYQRVARGKVISTTSELKQVATKKKFLYEQLSTQLNSLWISLRTFQRQVDLMEEELSLAEQVAAAERTNFLAGGSSVFLINQREQTTVEISLNLIAAQTSLQQAQGLIKFFSSTKLS